MIQKVTRYRTNDGKLHETENIATHHVVDTLCENVGKLMPLTTIPGLKYSQWLKIIDTLVGDKEKAETLYNILHKMIG